MRLVALIVTFGLLIYLISCNDAVGPVPEFAFNFDSLTEDIELSEYDTTQIEAGTLIITPGTVDVSAFEDLTSAPAGTLINIATAFDASVTGADRTFIESNDQSSVLGAVTSGDAGFFSSLEALESAFQGDALLATYLPTSTPPASSGRITGGSSAGNSSSAQPSIIDRPNAAAQDLDDCNAAALAAYDELIAELDEALAIQQSNISTRYTNQLSLLTTELTAERTAANERYATRLDQSLAVYNSFISYVNSLEPANLTAEQATSLRLFGLALYAFSIYESYLINLEELALIDSFQVDLDAQRDAALAAVQADYDRQVNRAGSLLSSPSNGCHNQGAGSGS